MGEMADYLIGEYYADQDNFDEYFYGRREDSDGPPVTILSCKYCGSKKVYWAKLETGKWRLHNKKDRQPHTCIEYTGRGKNA